MAKVKTARARVLADHAGLGIKCGQLIEGPEGIVKSLAAAGVVDNHADAVEYASGKGATVVSLQDSAAAAEVAAAIAEEKPAADDDASQAADDDASQTAAS